MSGRIAHDTLIRHFKLPSKSHSFAHLRTYNQAKLIAFKFLSLFAININTGRLTNEMFNNVFIKLKQIIRISVPLKFFVFDDPNHVVY